MKTVPRGYGSHPDFLDLVRASAQERARAVEGELRTAFGKYASEQKVVVIQLAAIDAYELGEILLRHPLTVKPLLIAANVAGRALARDLGIRNVNTYRPRLNAKQANVIAGYIKPFLPASVALPSLVQLDQVAFIDKEIRALKGRWEKRVTEALVTVSGRPFKKRQVEVGGAKFEIDAAYPAKGPVQYAVDVKRIEGTQDFHKRVDEIVNKATKVKKHNSKASFGTVIYFPFEDRHGDVRTRLAKSDVDAVAFAGETTDSIEKAVGELMTEMKFE